MKFALAKIRFLAVCLAGLCGCSDSGQVEEQPRDRWQVRHEQLYAQGLQSFSPPATNSSLEIVTKNNVHQSGTVVAISHDAIVLKVDGFTRTYSRDWLSEQTRSAILAPDYAESFAREGVEAEKAQIESTRLERARIEQERINKETADKEASAREELAEANRKREEEKIAKNDRDQLAEKAKAAEEARVYDLELRRRAELEWNENARKTGGAIFVGEPGSGHLDISPEVMRDQENSRIVSKELLEAIEIGRVAFGWRGGTEEELDQMLLRQERAGEYAAQIGELVGQAAGFEYQLNNLLDTGKRYQRVARISSDWREQRQALRKSEAILLSIPAIKERYFETLDTLIGLSIRDGQTFTDAMRLTASTPEVPEIVRSFCREFINE